MVKTVRGEYFLKAIFRKTDLNKISNDCFLPALKNREINFCLRSKDEKRGFFTILKKNAFKGEKEEEPFGRKEVFEGLSFTFF
jgi:hypothetical protein